MPSFFMSWFKSKIFVCIKLFLSVDSADFESIYAHRLLSGNKLSDSLPEELGYLPNLNRLQIDENYISGSIPKSFAHLSRIRHLWVDLKTKCYLNMRRSLVFLVLMCILSAYNFCSHMNNNSLSGQIPSELSNASTLIHLWVT